MRLDGLNNPFIVVRNVTSFLVMNYFFQEFVELDSHDTITSLASVKIPPRVKTPGYVLSLDILLF